MVSALALAVPPASSASDIDPATGEPSLNQEPTAAAQSCANAAGATPTCMAALLASIDAARADEGIAPMTLPPAFSNLSAPEQLLTLADLERIDRGLAPIAGLSPQLDADAQQGADINGDPSGPSGYSWASNWSGAALSLFNDFSWMYDDGPGSPNIGCSGPRTDGCWGHRANILGQYQTPIGMGAAASGDSQTQLFVAGYQPSLPGGPDLAGEPLWSSIARTLPVGVSPGAIRLSGGLSTATVRVWASGEPMVVRASIATKQSRWTVKPSTCDLQAGSSCVVTVSVSAPAVPSDATLTLAGPNGPQSVALVHTVPEQVAARLRSRTVRVRSSARVIGTLKPGVGHRRVLLQVAQGDHWRTVSRSLTDARGRFTLIDHPRRAGLRRYRVLVAAAGGYEGADSRPLILRVRDARRR